LQEQGKNQLAARLLVLGIDLKWVLYKRAIEIG
jgi:hypothetical protein